MSGTIVAACYGSATLLALFLLWRCGATHWYWHVLSIIGALAIGLTPLPELFNKTVPTLIVGWLFVFLFLWGIGAPVVAALHHEGHGALGHHHR